MAKTSSTTPASTKKKPAAAPAQHPRKLKKPVYASFRLQKRIKGKALPGSFRILRDAFGVLGRNWKIFIGIVVLYGVLNAVLVQGFSAAASLGDAKSSLDGLFSGNWGQLASGVTLFVYLLSVSGNTVSPTAGAYQLFLMLIMSLALIWALRQVYAGHTIRVRDAFYRGITPLVQFLMVLAVVGLQLLPLVLGFLLYNTATTTGIAASGLEQLLWTILLFLLALVSLYMICSSIFALYIVTLPDMTPLRALRSARQLVQYRRWATMRKFVFLPIAIVVLSGLIIIPLILLATPIAAWAFFAVTMMMLPIIHSYMYTLYRSLL